MARKINPFSFRLGVTEGFDWKSKWFNKKNYANNLKEDSEIREFIEKKLKTAAIEKTIIERSANLVTITVFSGRPGIIIGRGGTGAEELKKEIKKRIGGKIETRLNIQEVKSPDISAQLVAQNIARQLEKRISFRRVLKMSISRVAENKQAEGVKIVVAGRLDGSEMARREWLKKGRIPLQTLRANIDYAKENAYTTYGVIGIKDWIYKGEVFEKKES
jgi:small subunit ribosomal protein S3